MADEKKRLKRNQLGKDKLPKNSAPLDDESKETEEKAIPNVTENIPSPTIPSIEEDYKVLSEMNLFKAVLIKFQRDAHPKKEIESLLNRRISICRSDFEGPFIVRVISSILMVLTTGTIAWIVIWLIGSALGETNFLRELAGAMATMIAAIFGIALFQPTHLIDEKALKLAIDAELLKIESLIKDRKEQSERAKAEIDAKEEELKEGIKEEAKGDISINMDDSDPKLEDTLDGKEKNTEVS